MAKSSKRQHRPKRWTPWEKTVSSNTVRNVGPHGKRPSAVTLFFGLHRPDWTLAKILVLLAAILAMMRVFWRVDRPAALLLLPYATWVAFASALNNAIWRLN